MGGGKTSDARDAIVGQHLSLAVAAHLARVQLLSDPLARYDAQHIIEMVQAVAAALIHVAPLHVGDAVGGARRELTVAELDGATVGQGGTLLVLKDGRMLSGVTIRRGDLRQAIVILRSVGVPGLEQRERKPGASRARDQLQTLAQIEALVRQPAAAAQVNALLVTLAREATKGRVTNLAMQLMRALQQSNDDLVVLTLAQLRTALHAEDERTREG